jgi:anti-sigma factor RsiW
MTKGAAAGPGWNCAEVELLAEPYLDGEFEEAERAAVEAHLASCDACRSRVAATQSIRSALRAKLKEALAPGTPAGTAPESLRRRIAEALDRETADREAAARPAPWWRRAVSPLPVAAAAACVAGALVVLAGHRSADPLVEEAVRKHARDLPLELNAASLGPEAISSLLASKLEFNPRPPAFDAPGLRLVGARFAQLREWPAAYMRYETPRGHVGLFIVDDPGRRFGDTGTVHGGGPPSVKVINAHGYNVAVWRRNGIVYSVVSDLDEADLVRLVEAAQRTQR